MHVTTRLPIVKGAFLALMFMFSTQFANAHIIPKPCDFVTGGGFVKHGSGEKLNFGFNAGCKHHAFRGNFNAVDHRLKLHVKSIEVVSYTMIKGNALRRDFCGTASTNLYGNVGFHVVVVDNGEPGKADRFGLSLSNGYFLHTRTLSGGNIQLHKPNPSTTPPASFTECNKYGKDPGF